MTEVIYPYVGGNLLENRHNYAYAPYLGAAFLDAWRDTRDRFASGCQGAPAPVEGAQGPIKTYDGAVDTARLLGFINRGVLADAPTAELLHWRNWAIRRFELSKRLHTTYQIHGKAIRGDGDYGNLDLYLAFGECMSAGYLQHGHLPSLNALIKCLDTLCSLADGLGEVGRARLASLIASEQQAVAQLSDPETREVEVSPAASMVPSDGNFLPKVVMVLADTLRSRGYAQAIAHAGMTVDAVLVVEAADGLQRLGQSAEPPAPVSSLGVEYFVPDLRIGLGETCTTLSRNVRVHRAGTVNDDTVVEALNELHPDLVVFSGFGGEIVGEDFLNKAGKVLHMHAGWLPDYRGSTTTYYSMLCEGRCGVSAILLDSEIDVGAILCRKTYPIPPAGMEMDYLYDSVIRSDMLLELMGSLCRDDALPDSEGQDPQAGDIYYIIHPVLKHVAILNRPA